MAMEANLDERGWHVERLTPYDGLAWIDREWFWAVRRAILSQADPAQPIAPDTLPAARDFVARAEGR